MGSECKGIADYYVSMLIDAHDVFVSGEYTTAALKSLELVSFSATQALKYPQCNSQTISSAPTPYLYISYMLQEKGLPQLPQLPVLEQGLADGDKTILINLTNIISKDMIQACRSMPCSPFETKVFQYNEAMQNELKKQDPTYYVIAYYSAVIKGTIGRDFLNSNHTQLLNYIYEKNTMMLRILKPYVFQSQDAFSSINRKIIDYIIDEKNPTSFCSYTLSQYLVYTLKSPTDPNLTNLSLWHNQLYNVVNSELYWLNGHFYNGWCTISESELFNIPFKFTQEVKRQISQLQ